MFNNIVLFIVLFAAPILTNPGFEMRRAVAKPPEFAGQNGCYLPEVPMVLPQGQEYKTLESRTCMEYFCLEENATMIHSCHKVIYDKEYCKLAYDYSQPYPCCCGTLQCGTRPAVYLGSAHCIENIKTVP